jgi:uncharacterized protein YhfF
VSLSAVPEKYQIPRAFAFGDSPTLADELLALALEGETLMCERFRLVEIIDTAEQAP